MTTVGYWLETGKLRKIQDLLPLFLKAAESKNLESVSGKDLLAIPWPFFKPWTANTCNITLNVGVAKMLTQVNGFFFRFCLFWIVGSGLSVIVEKVSLYSPHCAESSSKPPTSFYHVLKLQA